MRRLANILLLILCITACINAHAYYYRQFTTSNHLISNQVYHAYRDRMGFMWFFTDKGVSRFDGTTFKNFTLSDGLTDNSIFSGYEDNTGRLWMYTYSGKPCFIKNDTVFNEDNCPWLRKVPSISFMQFIYEKGSSIYLGYIQGTLGKLDGTKYTPLVKDPVDNHLLTLTMIGDTLVLYKFSSTIYMKNDKVIAVRRERGRLVFHDFKKLLNITEEGIKIMDDHDHVLWEYNDPMLNLRTIRHMYFDEEKTVFCATNTGLYLINIYSNVKTRLFENITINSIAQDMYGNYWVTTESNGVYHLDKNLDLIRPLNIASHAKTYFLPNGQLVFIDNNSVLYLKNDSLCNIILPRHRKFTPMLITGKYFFYCSEDSTFCYNLITGITISALGIFFNIHEIATDTFLGFTRFSYSNIVVSNRTIFIRNYNLPHIVRRSCLYKNGKAFFAVNNNQVYSLNAYTGVVTPLDNLDTTQFIEQMHCVQNHLVLITSNKTVKIYDINNHYEKKTLTGLPFVCYNLWTAADRNSYLANTDKGYYMFSSTDDLETANHPLQYPVRPPDLFALYPSGQYMVCNLNGSYYIFHDSLINKEKQKPLLLVNSALINGLKYSGKRFYVKNNLQAHIAIKLSALKLVGDAGRYEYRIVSSKTSPWYSFTSDNLDIFLQKTGDYRIELRSATQNNIASDSKFIEITVLPPFYYSFNFYLLVAVSLAVLISFGVRAYNQRRLQVFRNELNYLQLEHKAINSLLNPHFIFNAINNIQSLVNHNATATANNYLAVLSKLIRQNMENLQFNFISVSKEINLVRNYIHLQNLRFNNRIQLQIDNSIEDLDSINIPPLLIHTFVENSVVHGFKKDNGNFIINIDLSLSVDDYLIIKVSDNGAGLSQKKINSAISDKMSMGIDFIHKRLARLSEFYKVTYSIDIQNISRNGETGTEVTVILYAKFANENMALSMN